MDVPEYRKYSINKNNFKSIEILINNKFENVGLKYRVYEPRVNIL